MDRTTLLVLAITFLATLFRSAFGFGEALVAVPLLALLIPVKEAVPLATLVSITVALVVVIQDWRKIHVRSAWILVLSTMAGIPLGLWMLVAAPEPVVKAALAVVIIGFSIYCLIRRHRLELKTDGLAWIFGFLAGILGGAYGMNGPPLVVYGSLRHWTPEQFRATLQGYFLPASLVGMIGYTIAGLWTPTVTRYYIWSLPLAIVAIFLGRAINRRLHGTAFYRYVYVGLLGIGVVLLVQAANAFMAFGLPSPTSIDMDQYQPGRRGTRVNPGLYEDGSAADVETQDVRQVTHIQPPPRQRRHTSGSCRAVRPGPVPRTPSAMRPQEHQVAGLRRCDELAVGVKQRSLAEALLAPLHLAVRKVDAAEVDAFVELAGEAVQKALDGRPASPSSRS